MSFDVNTPARAAASGTKGRPPVAIRICLAVTDRPVASRTQWASSTVARASKTVTPAAASPLR